MRVCIEARLVRTPLVVLSSVCAREVVEKAGLQARAFVWIEGLDAGDHHAAREWYAEDRSANPPTIGDERRGTFLDELETYVDTYKPRQRSDVVYVNVR
jgi:hypothetical protein